MSLADAWTEIGLKEHASIAAFARFTLQLMSLGAPCELVERSTAAMAEETTHAKLAFALASTYRGQNVGPGTLDIEKALDASSLRDIVLGTLREGCIGETIAALEAAEALEHATDPAVRATLQRITEDETKHAVLAWRFVRWAMDRAGPALRHEAMRELEREAMRALGDLTQVSRTPEDTELLAHGILSQPLRALVRATAVHDVVLRCGRLILEEDPDFADINSTAA
jgi:hypothetical protein